MKTITGELTLSSAKDSLSHYYRLSRAGEDIKRIMASDLLYTWINESVTNGYGGGNHYELFLNLDSRTLFYLTTTKLEQTITSGNVVRVGRYYNPSTETYEYSEVESDNMRDYIQSNITRAILEDPNYERT